MVSAIRALAATTAAGARAQRVETSGTTYVSLHSGRKRFMKGYVFRKYMQMNPLSRKTEYQDCTVTDTQVMSLNRYDVTLDTINQQSYSSFASSCPTHMDQWIALANNMRADSSAATQSDKVYVKSTEVACEFKNENAQPCELDVWVFYPRRDIPVPATVGSTYSPLPTLATIGGTGQPPLLRWGLENEAAEANALLYSGAGYDLAARDTTPFQSTQWCMTMRATKTRPRHFTLQGGQSVKLKLTDWHSKVVSMGKYGLFDGTTIAANYHYLKDNGPLILFRVRGCQIHNEALVTGTNNNTNFGVAYGAYSVSASMQYKHNLIVPMTYSYADDLPKKVRMQTGAFGFTSTAPYNTIADITQADTRDRNQAEKRYET